MNKFSIGIIVGGGVGSELVDCFSGAAAIVGKKLGLNMHVDVSPNRYSTFYDLQDKDINEITSLVKADARLLVDDYRRFAHSVQAVFRTAINAEALYIARAQTLSVKPELFTFGKNRILLVRDETQGFYAPDRIEYSDGRADITSSFTQENFQKVIEYAKMLSHEVFGRKTDCWAVYKHHCVGNVVAQWVKHIAPDMITIQPNDATERIFKMVEAEGNSSDLVILAGNEVGDLVYEIFSHFSTGHRRTQEYSSDILLHPDFHNLAVYQTVHGSVDVLKGKNMANPTATIHALAAMLENHAGETGLRSSLMNAVNKLYAEGKMTVDFGGVMTTTEYAKALVSVWMEK